MAVNITIELLQSLLAQSDPQVIVDSFQVSTGTGRGDNYTAMLYRVYVEGKTINEEMEATPWTRSLIYKCLPDDPERRRAFKSDILFRNEVAVYTKALPTLMAFQASRGSRVATPFNAVATCYLARSDRLVLEDLKERGFVMADRKSGLNLEQCSRVIRELARFHALSLAMKYCKPQEFAVVVAGSVKEAMFLPEHEEWYRAYYRTATRNAFNMVREALPPEADRDKYLDRFRTFIDIDTFFDRMVNLVSPREPLAVLCHGDCWTNNILFRYVNDDITEVRLVDFQMARYGSPALDLANLIYCCTSHALRTEHLQHMLADYHATLVIQLAELVDVEEQIGDEDLVDPYKLWDILQDEFHRCGRFGLGLALDIIPISMCDSNQAPDLYVTAPSDDDDDDDNVDEQHENSQQTNNVPVWTSSENCRRKMADLVQELVDNGDL